MNNEMCSGFERYHTDNPASPKAKPFDTVTYIEIIVMAKKPPSVLKQHAQWFIPSTLLSRSKNHQRKNGRFFCLVLDLDHNPPNIYKVAEIIKLIFSGCDFLIYTSKSATENCQKCHVIIPTVKLTGYRWYLAQQLLNDKVELAGITPDRKTEDANQIIFLPNRGVYYNFIHHKGTIFDPIKVWYPELLKKHQVLEDKKQVALVKKATARPARTTQGRSLIDEFNATYTVEELLIQAGYAQKGTNFRHPNSQTGNYSASVKDGKVYTLSSSDLLFSEFSHDSWSVFVLLFHEGNFKEAILDAGNSWLTIGNLTWNQHQQKLYRENNQ